jgi:hypothetical protein
MKYILTIESYYKKRGLLGKASDWIAGRKDFNELIQVDSLAWKRTVYSCDMSNPSDINVTNLDNNIIDTLKFCKDNPGKFLIFNLCDYKSWSGHHLIKFTILIRDLLEVCHHRLDIISITIKEYSNKFLVDIKLREIGFEEGDGMPLDIYNEYIDMIEIGLRKKKEKYLKEYNILQSIKYDHTTLYDILIPPYQPSWDKRWGLLKIVIEPTK